MNKNKNYVTGAVILTVGALVSKFLGMFFKIPLTNIIGDYGMGLYGYVYPLYSTFLTLSTAGLPSAVSKMVSESISEGYYAKSYRIFYISFVALALLGIAASVIMFAGANAFISFFSWDSNVYYSIIAISFAPFFACLVSSVRGFFQGMQNMVYTGISQIIEQIGRVVVGVSLAVYLMNTRGIEWAAAGAAFGAAAGAIVSFIYLYISFCLYRNKHREALVSHQYEQKESNSAIIKTLIMIAIPIACSSAITTIMELINSATVSSSLQQIGYSVEEATDLYGQLTSKAQTLVNVPLVIGTSLAASLVPSISESVMKKDIKKARKKSTLAIKLSLLLAVPSSVGLYLLAEPIIKLLYSKAYYGYEMLSMLALSIVFCVLMSCLQGILQGAGKYYAPLVNMFVGGVVKIVLNLILVRIPSLNIYGAIISTIVATAVIAILNFISVKKYVGFDGLFIPIVKIFISSGIMAIVCVFSYKTLLKIMSFKIAVVLSIFISIVVYAISVIIIKAITTDELRSVRS